MTKKKGRQAKKKNQTNGRRKESRRESTTSTSTDFHNERFIGIDKLNLNEEDENFFRNLILSNKVNTNSQIISRQIRPKGLTNLGNTCYLNSIIQVLSQTPFFYELLNERADPYINWQAIHKDYFKNLINRPHVNDFKLTCKLSAPSILISTLVSLLRNLRSELKLSSIVITPSNFVREITSSFTQFKNYDQQDSHEFLRCLLDAIRINEISRQRKGILESLNLDFKKIKQIKDNDEKLNLIKSYSDSSNFTVIDQLFGGYCISSLKCQDCHFTSQIFESFFDLSLPISEESDNFNNYHNLNRKQQHQKFNLKDKKNSKITVKNRNLNGQKLTTKNEKDIEETDTVDTNQKNLVENEEFKNLSLKERKLRRQLKKATRRENKKVSKSNYKADLKEDNEKSEITTVLISKSNSKEEEDDDLIEDSDRQIKINQLRNNELKLKNDNFYKQENSTLNGEKNRTEEDGESSDDEASSNEFSELKNDLSEENSNKTEFISNKKTVQSNNSIDSGINSSNLASEADNCKIRNMVKTISPVHEEATDSEQNVKEEFRIEQCLDQTKNNSEKESDTGFEDKNGEADSEDSNSANIDDKIDDDSEKEISFKIKDNQSTLLDNDNVFNDENANENERKSVRNSSAMENSDLFKRKIKWTLSTISASNESSSVSCSVLTGLTRFTKIELLVGANKILCENCSQKFKNKNGVQKKIYTNGSKQMLIALPPPILTLHLKRFELSNYRSLSLSKINKFVHFPLVFDLSPYVSNVYKIISGLTSDKSERETKSIIYSLYGIVEHSGSLRSGHYKAYVRCNNKDSDNLKKFIRLKPYVPKVVDLMNSITLDDIEKTEEDQQLNEMLLDMNLKDESSNQMNGDLGDNLNSNTANSTNLDATNKIKEELIKLTKENWFHISDSSVTQIQLKTMLKVQAYLLFYERRH